MIAPLQDTLAKCIPLRPDLLEKLAAHLLAFHANGVSAAPPEPHFAEEVTPPVGPVFDLFRPALDEWSVGGAGEGNLRKWADAFGAAAIDGVLLLLGQRRTPASLTDASALPPTRGELLAAADTPHTPGGKLSVAARAWAKHAPRSGSKFWGTVTGGDVEKTAAARRLLETILDGATWWNVFGHFQHGTVYEARLPSGHGARWGHGGRTFIGFLEPFAK
jgi:hypothetical protein